LSWSPAYTPTFRRDYNNLGQQNQRKVDGAIRDILNSEDPRRVGRAKLGRWRGAYGYDVGRDVRVLYSLEARERLVVFLRCGPHTIY
jgi:mRNA-degrading endonuclease RelE of RelBE toxin-antitoxin system